MIEKPIISYPFCFPNTVGYLEQTMKTSTGYNFICPTFVDVNSGEATWNLQDIKLVGAYGDGMTDSIIGYDSYACVTEDDYYWATVEGSIFSPVMQDGWYKGALGTELVTDVTKPVGHGLYLNLGSEGATVQYAGKVYEDGYTSPALQTGYNMLGNATPVPLDLQQIKLVDAYGDGMTDSIIGYDSYACITEDDYYWATVEGSIFSPVKQDGWYKGALGTELVTGVTLQPGQGFYFNIGTEGAKYQLPAVITQ